jgi:polysaccharide biosynthesis/export protein
MRSDNYIRQNQRDIQRDRSITERSRRSLGKSFSLWLACSLASVSGLATAAERPSAAPPLPVLEGRSAARSSTAVKIKPSAEANYILGPGDQISIHVVNFQEIPRTPMPVDLTGWIPLPLVGRVQVSGLTTSQVAAELSRRLEEYLLHPDVSVSVVEFRSQPVSVLGAVRNPGVQQVQGRKTLVEVLSVAGGLDQNAGSTLKITRRLEWGRIPLASAKDDPTGEFSIAEISLKSILAATNPEENILVQPHDVVSVPRADTVYVIGQVQKAGGFVLSDHEKVTVLQALSMAGGLDRVAQPQSSKLLRRVPDDPSRVEVPVDLKKILAGKIPDIQMQPDDILFVPNSLPKRASVRALEAAVQMATGLVIWRR